MRHDNFLILDEPTNHLDIESKEVLEKALLNFNGTVLFVSHDRYFINKVATEVIEISPEGSTLYLGNYDYYAEKRQEQEMLAQAAAAKENPASAEQPKQPSAGMQNYKQSKERQKQERKLRRTVDKLENQVGDLEDQKAAIEQQMTDPEVFNDVAKMQDLQKQLEKVTTDLSAAEDEWEEKLLELDEFEN